MTISTEYELKLLVSQKSNLQVFCSYKNTYCNYQFVTCLFNLNTGAILGSVMSSIIILIGIISISQRLCDKTGNRYVNE